MTDREMQRNLAHLISAEAELLSGDLSKRLHKAAGMVHSEDIDLPSALWLCGSWLIKLSGGSAPAADDFPFSNTESTLNWLSTKFSFIEMGVWPWDKEVEE